MRSGALRLHAHTAATLALVRLLLPHLGVERALRATVFLGEHAPRSPHDPGRAVRAVRRLARRLIPGTACLAQSIALVGVLTAQRATPELVIGCRHTDVGWVAHAWVDCDGQRLEPVIGGSQLELGRYRRRDRWRLRSTSAPETGAHRATDATS